MIDDSHTFELFEYFSTEQLTDHNCGVYPEFGPHSFPPPHHMYFFIIRTIQQVSAPLTCVGAGGQHVDPLHLFGIVVLLAALALARGLRQTRALLEQLPRAVVEQHDLRGHRAGRGLVVLVRRAADAELAEDLPPHRLDAPGLLLVQVDGLARVDGLHQQDAGRAEQQQEQREAGEPHCPARSRSVARDRAQSKSVAQPVNLDPNLSRFFF